MEFTALTNKIPPRIWFQMIAFCTIVVSYNKIRGGTKTADAPGWSTSRVDAVKCLIWYSQTCVLQLPSKIVVVVDRSSLFRCHLCKKRLQMGPQNGGRYRQVVAIRRFDCTW